MNKKGIDIIMIIVLVKCGNGYCGCESEEAFFYDDGTTESEMEEDILCWARENAESFAYVHFGWDEPYTDEDYEDYLENYVNYDYHIASYEEYLDYCENWGYEPKVFD